MKGKATRFYNEVVLSYEGKGCLVWPFSRDTNGYGLLGRNGKVRPVHRLLCHDINGAPPTSNHQVAHSCGNRACVNPMHLRWATKAENEADKILHGTIARGESHGRADLSEGEVIEIRSLRGRETQASIAKRFGISAPAVSRIQRGKSWAWL